MNTLLYRCFLTVAEEMNFTRAAERLFISQQTLSHHIAKLEAKFGSSFFKRTKPLQLTYAGERMLKLAQEAINLERRMYNEMGDVCAENTGELSIGVGRDRFYLLSSIIPMFNEQFPKYTINCIGGFHQQLIQMLIANRIDLMISSTPQNIMDFESIPIMDDYLVLCINNKLLLKYYPQFFSESHNSTDTISFTPFEVCPLALASGRIRSRIMSESFFRTHHFKPNIITTIDYSEGLLGFVKTGLCATICFYQPLKHRLQQMNTSIANQIQLLKIDGLSTPVKVQATWLSNSYHSRALSTFRTLLQNYNSQA